MYTFSSWQGVDRTAQHCFETHFQVMVAIFVHFLLNFMMMCGQLSLVHYAKITHYAMWRCIKSFSWHSLLVTFLQAFVLCLVLIINSCENVRTRKSRLAFGVIKTSDFFPVRNEEINVNQVSRHSLHSKLQSTSDSDHLRV